MDIEKIVEENYNKLNESDLHIWKYILHNKKECSCMSIQELAKRCNVSHTTILRFTQKLNLEGYSEMKVYLKWESKREISLDNKDVQYMYNDIEQTMEYMKNRDFSDVFKLIEAAKSIYIYGSGDVQKEAARDLKRNMIFASKLMYTIEGKEETNTVLDKVEEQDVFFLISLSGNNTFMNELACKLREKGVKIIAITKASNNGLASISHVSIQFYTHAVYIEENKTKIYTAAQFFIINQIMLLKYLEYKNF